MLRLNFLIIISVAFTLISCTHLNSVSTTSIPAKRGKKVSVERSKFIFLALNFSNAYVEDMAVDLAKKCPNGRIQGLLTKHERITYFPILFHRVRVSAQGYCNQPTSRSRKRRR